MQNILIEDRLFAIPSNYNEATPGQIRAIVRYDSRKMKASDRFLMILLCLMDGPGRLWLRFRWFFKLTKAEAMLEMLDFTPEIEHFLSNTIPFYQQKFPVLRRFKQLYGPGDALSTITFRQYRQTEEIGYRYRETKDEKDLDELLSVLYLRKPYTELWYKSVPERLMILDEQMVYRKKIISRIPMDQKQAIFLWYLGSRSVLMHQFTRIFSSGKKSSEESDSAKITPAQIGSSYARLLDGLAEKATNYAEWDATNIYDVLNNYQEKLQESDRVKEASRNRKPA
ncbi:hypothetical protein [Siphonobacter sp.]|uniref:hypothetical protein n=1 Tax=Siphonobacter sp. TaxID=1869184 RepID=UPI003B3BD075